MMTVNRHLTGPFAGEGLATAGTVVWTIASLASVAASAYHGAKRNGGSIGWGLWWGFVGGVFPVVTPAIAAAQGFGKCKNNCGSR